MKREIQLFCASAFAALLAVSAFAETTWETVDGQYVITVPEGESCWMTENEEATFHDCTALVKKGKGTLVIGSNANMKNYAGTIYIKEGIYLSQSMSGLGSESAVTYVDGGTFQNALMQGGDAAIYPGKAHLKGTGHNDGTRDLGAFCNTRNTPYGAGFANVVLDDDTLITITRNWSDSSCETSICNSLDMNGHHLTIRANGTYCEPVLCSLGIKSFANLGNIVVDHAKLSIGAVLMETCTTSLKLTNGGVLEYTNAGEGVKDRHPGQRLVVFERRQEAVHHVERQQCRHERVGVDHPRQREREEAAACAAVRLLSVARALLVAAYAREEGPDDQPLVRRLTRDYGIAIDETVADRTTDDGHPTTEAASTSSPCSLDTSTILMTNIRLFEHSAISPDSPLRGARPF